MRYDLSGLTNVSGMGSLITTSDNIVGGVLVSSFLVFLFVAFVIIGLYSGLKIQQSLFANALLISFISGLLTWVGFVDLGITLGFIIGTVCFAIWSYYDRC